MYLIDVNILVYAHRSDSSIHGRCYSWLEGVINGEAAFGIADLVLSGFLRIVTHPRIFARPTPIETALSIASGLRSRPNCVIVSPADRHWEIFTRLCREAGTRGNLIPDAYLAALAIEFGAEWVTTDRDYARFTGLKWRQP